MKSDREIEILFRRLRLYDQLRRQRQQVTRFEELLEETLQPWLRGELESHPQDSAAASHAAPGTAAKAAANHDGGAGTDTLPNATAMFVPST